jgi:hypothetical protein
MTYGLRLQRYTVRTIIMAEQNTSGKIPLTIYLSAEVAARLKAAAETQRQTAGDLVAELLARHLPRLPGTGAKPGSIPYS